MPLYTVRIRQRKTGGNVPRRVRVIVRLLMNRSEGYFVPGSHLPNISQNIRLQLARSEGLEGCKKCQVKIFEKRLKFWRFSENRPCRRLKIKVFLSLSM